MVPIKQTTAREWDFFAMDANGDGVTGVADGSWTKRIKKSGGSFGAMTVTITELENGWYKLTLSTAHTDTLGCLSISLSATGVKRVNLQFLVFARTIDDVATPAQVNAEVVDAVAVDVIPDAVPADGSRPTIAQALYMITQFLMERAVSGTTLTVRKPDGSTALMTLTLNDATSPTSITRAT